MNLQRMMRFVCSGLIVSGYSGHGGGDGRWELRGWRERGGDEGGNFGVGESGRHESEQRM